MFQYSPIISPNEFQYVHHLLIYLCNNLEATDIGASAPCGGAVSATVSQCLSGELIAAWAVGGNVRHTGIYTCKFIYSFSKVLDGCLS